MLIVFALATALSAAEPAAAQTATPGCAPTSGAVEAAFQAVQSSVEARDVRTLEAIVHPGFEMLHGSGATEQRDAWLKLVSAGTLLRQTAELSDFSDFGVTTSVVGSIAFRTAIVRYTSSGRDLWVRGTVTFICDMDRWRQLRQQSTVIGEGQSAVLTKASDYVGFYSIPGGDRFEIMDDAGLLTLRWANGARLPLTPRGGDRFNSGPTSQIDFSRSKNGAVVAVTRIGPAGVLWAATRQR
jgi:hypothetical protein